MSVLRLGLALQLGGSLLRLLPSPHSQASHGAAEGEQGESGYPSEREPVVFDGGYIPGQAGIDGTEHGHRDRLLPRSERPVARVRTEAWAPEGHRPIMPQAVACHLTGEGYGPGRSRGEPSGRTLPRHRRRFDHHWSISAESAWCGPAQRSPGHGSSSPCMATWLGAKSTTRPAASREVLLPYSTWQPLAFAGSWEIWRDVEEQCAGDGDRGLPIGSPGRLSLSTRWPRGIRAMACRR